MVVVATLVCGAEEHQQDRSGGINDGENHISRYSLDWAVSKEAGLGGGGRSLSSVDPRAVVETFDNMWANVGAC